MSKKLSKYKEPGQGSMSRDEMSVILDKAGVQAIVKTLTETIAKLNLEVFLPRNCSVDWGFSIGKDRDDSPGNLEYTRQLAVKILDGIDPNERRNGEEVHPDVKILNPKGNVFD